jgi:uncharacterized protein YllA (UPF0747 family)
VKARSLPGYDALFVDYLENSLRGEVRMPPLPTLLTMSQRALSVAHDRACSPILLELASAQAAAFQSAARSRDSIARLGRPGTVGILVWIQADCLGGTLAQVLKCLVAAKLASELESLGMAAIPVCLITGSFDDDDGRSLAVGILDSESRFHRFSLAAKPVHDRGDLKVPEEISALIDQIAIASGRSGDEEILLQARHAYAPGIPLTLAAGRFCSELLESHGFVILDTTHPDFDAAADQELKRLGLGPEQARLSVGSRSRHLRESRYAPLPDPLLADPWQVSYPVALEAMLPVAAHVMGSDNAAWFASIFPLFEMCGLGAPLLWPCAGATIVDGRSRKILERYGLNLSELFDSGAGGRTGRQINSRADKAAALCLGMIQDATATLASLRASMPSGDELQVAAETVGEKAGYQMARLKERVLASAGIQLETATRQIDRLSSALAPNGSLQERELGALHFLLRFSRSLLEVLYERLDPANFEHQIIAVD